LDEALKAAALLPDLKAAQAALRAAEAGVKSAGRWPGLSFSFATRSITARESYALSVPLPWPGRGARLDFAKAGVALAGTDQEAARLLARRALRLAWFTVAAREDMAKAAMDRAARVKATADAVALLYESGRVAQLELSRAKADAAMAAADETQVEEEHRIAESVLRRLLGIDSSQRIQVERPLPAFAAEPDIETASAQALARSPAAKAAEARVQSAEAAVRLASALRSPGIAVEGGADRADPTQPGTDYSIGVSVTVPFSGGPALDIAKGERDRVLAVRDQTKREIADAVEQAWRTAQAARQRYEALEKDALPAATQSADLAQVAYREGRSDIFRVLDAERALAEARAGLAEAYLAWGVAHADLLNAIGEDLQ
jgi:outer membrane protein TolC